MVVVGMCMSEAEDMESYMVLKSRFGPFGQDLLA